MVPFDCCNNIAADLYYYGESESEGGEAKCHLTIARQLFRQLRATFGAVAETAAQLFIATLTPLLFAILLI